MDIKGDGGFIIAPPSITKWGKYSWECSYQIFQQGPLPLPEKFYLPVGQKRSFNGSGCTLGSVSSRLLDPVFEGNRNDEITKRCGLLVSRYPANDALKMLELINQKCCQPPLDQRELNQIFASIKEKLYEEFEANSYKLLGVPGNRVREVLSDKGEDIDAEFEAAWDFGGAAFMRQCMSLTLCRLEQIYHERDLGRNLTQNEADERYTAWDIGLDTKTIDEYYLKKQEQDEAVQGQ